MKPQSIKLFDYFYLGAMFFGLLGFISGYDVLKAQLAAQSTASGISIPPVVLLIAYAVGAAIGLLLWYLVSHTRLIIAKWIIVLLFLISLMGVGDYFAGAMPLSEIYGLLGLIAQAVAVGLLFRGDAIRWLEGKDSAAEPEDTPVDPT